MHRTVPIGNAQVFEDLPGNVSLENALGRVLLQQTSMVRTIQRQGGNTMAKTVELNGKHNATYPIDKR